MKGDDVVGVDDEEDSDWVRAKLLASRQFSRNYFSANPGLLTLDLLPFPIHGTVLIKLRVD